MRTTFARALRVVGVIALGALGGALVGGWASATRNSSGSYSITASGTYPFVPHTAISSTTVGSIFNDLASEMSDSLSRSGKGGMSAPLRVPDGAVGAPTLSFNNETTSGLWRNTASDVRMSVAGTAKSGWNAAGFRLLDSGSAFGINLAAPSLAASYTVTMPTAVPASTLPITMTNAGVLSAGQITAAQIANGTLTNTQQGFGTPSAATDVTIKSYTDARFVVAGRTSGNTAGGCGTLYQVNDGTHTASCQRNGSGTFQINVGSLTTHAIVLVTQVPGVCASATTNAGALVIQVSSGASCGTPCDTCDFTFEVLQL